jgi:hypothetical protein
MSKYTTWPIMTRLPGKLGLTAVSKTRIALPIESNAIDIIRRLLNTLAVPAKFSYTTAMAFSKLPGRRNHKIFLIQKLKLAKSI